jgi:cytochrome c
MAARVIVCGAAILAAGCSAEKGPHLDAASVARGEWLSHNCTPCHNLRQRVNRVGPHLVEVIGRRAGAVDGYDYSLEMKTSDVRWTPEAIEAFIEWPLGVAPEGRMALAPMSERDARDVVTYLRSLDRGR